MGIECALVLGMMIFVYCKDNRRWSGLLWWRHRGLRNEENEGYPLPMINLSGDKNASRNISPSASMVTTVYSAGRDKPDAIRKLHPSIIGDQEKNKSDN